MKKTLFILLLLMLSVVYMQFLDFVNYGYSERHLQRKEASYLKGNGFEVAVLDSGEMEIEINKERYIISSFFSYPGNRMGYNSLAHEKGEDEPNWEPQVRQLSENKIEVISEGKYYILYRKVVLKEKKIEIYDTLNNKMDQSIGIIINHKITLPDSPYYFRIAGVEEKDTVRGVTENPTIFVSQQKSSLGFVAEDNILRLQGEIIKRGNSFNYIDKHFALDKDEKYTFSFTLYPQKNREYFAFINEVRQDWNVNFTIEGPFVFDSNYISERKAKIYAIRPWFGYYAFNPQTKKNYTREDYKKAVQPIIKKIKSYQPDAICIGMLITNLFTIDKRQIKSSGILSNVNTGKYGLILNEKQSEVLEQEFKEWNDSVIRADDGRIVIDTYYSSLLPEGENLINLFVYPEEGNYRYKLFLDQINFLMDEVGLDGVYIDQFSLGWGPLCVTDRCTYEKWDGYTVDIDSKTGLITKKYTDLSLLGAEARRKIIEYVLSKGKTVVINTFPTVRKEQDLRAFRFAEFENEPIELLQHLDRKPPTLYTLAKGHLSSPIVLGIRPERHKGGKKLHNELFMKSIITALRNGLLYYYYTASIQSGDKGINGDDPLSHMFPFTPVELNEGYLIGKERVITCISNKFVWKGAKKPVVNFFDLQGKKKMRDVRMSKRNDSWEIEITLDDWNEIAIIEESPA